MDTTSEKTAAWKAHRHQTQERHAVNHTRNRQLIAASGIPYTDKGEALLFREANKPATDFYPSTGRWKVGTQMFSGGAAKFLAWYAKAVAA